MCWLRHRAYDTGRLDLLPHLEPRWRTEIAHAVMHLGLISAYRRLTGGRLPSGDPAGRVMTALLVLVTLAIVLVGGVNFRRRDRFARRRGDVDPPGARGRRADGWLAVALLATLIVCLVLSATGEVRLLRGDAANWQRLAVAALAAVFGTVTIYDMVRDWCRRRRIRRRRARTGSGPPR